MEGNLAEALLLTCRQRGQPPEALPPHGHRTEGNLTEALLLTCRDEHVQTKLQTGTWRAHQPSVRWQDVLPDPAGLLQQLWGDGAELRWEELARYDDQLFSAPKAQ